MREQATYGIRESQHLGRDIESVDQLIEIQSVHLARFSAGMERLPETPARMRPGRFSEGIEQLPETVKKLRRGSFADGLEEARQRRRRTEQTRRLRPAA